MRQEIKIAQIGLGHWGQNLLRNFINNPRADVVAICDHDQKQIDRALLIAPAARVYSCINELLNNPDIQAVSIATPSGEHFTHASAALKAGKAVFVEKPMTMSLKDAVALAKISSDTGQLVMVGHTYLYNSIVQNVKEHVSSGVLGDVYYAYGQRLNLGKFRHDCDVIWTLAPHDISIFNYWFDDCPHQVSARTLSYVGQNAGHAEICFAQLDYANGISAHLHLSWLDPQKVRRSVIAGSKKMLVYDDVDQSRPIQLYDKSRELNDIISGNSQGYNSTMRAGDVHILDVSTKEPLYLELDHFIDCILNDAPCSSDVYHGLEVALIMDALSRSANNNGAPISIEHPRQSREI